MELEITWGRVIRVWWAHLWRSLVAAIVSMLLGGLVGGIIGAIFYMVGVTSPETLQLVITPISIVIGLVVSVFPIKMILGKDFGEFRLVLVENGSTMETKSRESGGVVQ
ncbi:hypothetical protein [Prosthecochloris sp.]|uniref:hypothetical protein n=1 Tax=Prosthecochloris sp. TaxID=290513 RepID=UPI0025DE79CA|nr:hypothetical protein [Prosthecochloris sp.]